MTENALLPDVIQKLSTVVDPETGVDVVHMRLVKVSEISAEGVVSTVFRPSSPLCPIAVPLALAVIKAISEVPGVTAQRMTVVDYIQAGQLNEILKSILED